MDYYGLGLALSSSSGKRLLYPLWLNGKYASSHSLCLRKNPTQNSSFCVTNGKFHFHLLSLLQNFHLIKILRLFDDVDANVSGLV